MPCDQIRLAQVDFTVTHPDVLKAAMKALGWRVVESTKTGLVAYTPQGDRFAVDYTRKVATVPSGREATVDAVKREYAFKMGEAAAKRFNWTFKRTGQNSFVINRRS